MIPHHQVAIDMSVLLIPNITDPVVLHLCRDIIRKQEYEIWEMTMMLKRISDTAFSSHNRNYDKIFTKLDPSNFLGHISYRPKTFFIEKIFLAIKMLEPKI